MDTDINVKNLTPKVPLVLTPYRVAKVFPAIAIALLGPCAFAVTYVVLEVARLSPLLNGASYALLAVGLFGVYRWMATGSNTTLTVDAWGLRCKGGPLWEIPWHQIGCWYCVSIKKSQIGILLDTRNSKTYWIPAAITHHGKNSVLLYFSLLTFCGSPTAYAKRLSFLQRLLQPLSSVEKDFRFLELEMNLSVHQMTGKDLSDS